MRYIVQCHSCEIPTSEQAFSDKNKSIDFARNHSNELKHCCSVMEEGPTIQVSPIHYLGTPGKFIAYFISGKERELLSNQIKKRTIYEHHPPL